MDQAVPRTAVAEAGFRTTDFREGGRRAWAALHAAAERFPPAYRELMTVFHDLINVGLGKPPVVHAGGALLAWLPPPTGTVQRKPRLPPPKSSAGELRDFRRTIASIIADTAVVDCAHCRGHGLRWFHALLDFNGAEAERPATLLCTFYQMRALARHVGTAELPAPERRSPQRVRFAEPAKPDDAKPDDAKPGDAKPGDAKPGDAKRRRRAPPWELFLS